MKDNKKIKIISLIISIILTLTAITLFFIDTSLGWVPLKIISCIICCIWVFFLTPTILYIFIRLKNSNLEYSVHFGLKVGTNGLWEILMTPYFGIKFYLANLDKIKFDD